MHLEGSCHCGAVRFSLESRAPWPYQRCYCSICRKTGGSDCMINLGGETSTFEVHGMEHVRIYSAKIDRGGKQVQSRHQRHFCTRCGSHLWAWHPSWPDHIHPVASAIDTPLPRAPAEVHMMLASRAPWVPVKAGPDDEQYDHYPERSLADWHEQHGYQDPKK